MLETHPNLIFLMVTHDSTLESLECEKIMQFIGQVDFLFQLYLGGIFAQLFFPAESCFCFASNKSMNKIYVCDDDDDDEDDG